MIRRVSTIVFASLLAAAFVRADSTTEYIGMFLQGQRLGYMTTSVHNEPEGRRTVTGTFLNIQLLGDSTRITMLSESWADKQGRLQKQEFSIDSAGRRQIVKATFRENEVHVVRESDGNTDERILDIPEGAVIVDDPTLGMMGKGLPEAGTKESFYALDPMMLVLIKTDIEFKGEKEIQLDGATKQAYWIQATEPRGATDFYLDQEGNMLYATTVLGISMRLISREEALGDTGPAPILDLAYATSVPTDRPIENPRNVERLVLELSGKPLERLRSDYNQTVSRSGDVIMLELHPQRRAMGEAAAISDLKSTKPQFAEPTTYIPADNEEMRRLAAEILNGETNSQRAAVAIANHVARIMRPNASIGLLRDAREILRTKEGVCRDYAILAATLMRAAGIPTKVVTGATYADGSFFYHAWVEAWVGDYWLALDPTLSAGRFVDATHIKFAEGNPDEAFITFTLDGVRIRVVEVVQRRD